MHLAFTTLPQGPKHLLLLVAPLENKIPQKFLRMRIEENGTKPWKTDKAIRNLVNHEILTFLIT